eukprot:GCRY01004336.1.p1 GENE.GCRY01004336.1~~GCRY01004336.1.p1  ORF type:complete len:220 (+),score=26.11 GCRY01004336.1:142-801(+)
MEGKKPLPCEFFEKGALKVAQDLLGQHLCFYNSSNQVERHVILETEAYIGVEDKACHAFGKTESNPGRAALFFGPACVWYVYLCYGIHNMLNVVCGPPSQPEAVLIRSVGQFIGPGVLTKALGISVKQHNGLSAASDILWIEKGCTSPVEFTATPRIGVDYAGSFWSQQCFRFLFVEELERRGFYLDSKGKIRRKPKKRKAKADVDSASPKPKLRVISH